MVAERTGAQAEASTRQALAAAELPALREAEAAAAAALQRLVVARETLEREETRAKERMAELDRRLVQLGDDIERERQPVAATRRRRWRGSPPKRKRCKRDIDANEAEARRRRPARRRSRRGARRLRKRPSAN